MMPLIILLSTFGLCAIACKFFLNQYSFVLSARISMSVMLFFTASGHFLFAPGMAMMVPDFLKFKIEIIYFTGFLEIALGICLLIPKLNKFAAWASIVFFIIVLPANIKAAIGHIDYQTGNFDGNGPGYLWFRVPLQFFFITWVYLSSIKKYNNQTKFKS